MHFIYLGHNPKKTVGADNLEQFWQNTMRLRLSEDNVSIVTAYSQK